MDENYDSFGQNGNLWLIKFNELKESGKMNKFLMIILILKIMIKVKGISNAYEKG